MKKTKKSTQKADNKLCNCAKSDTYVSDTDRPRRFSLQLYASPEHWGSLLEKAQHYAYIYHDKDKNADGTDKTPHYHLLVTFADGKTKSSLLKMTDIGKLDKDTTVNFQKMLNPRQSFRYLLHDTPNSIAEGKYKYSLDELTYDNVDFWTDTDVNDSNAEFLDDLLNDTMTERSMALKYGRDYIRNRRCYRDFAHELAVEDIKLSVTQNRDDLLDALAEADNAEVISSNEVDDLIIDYVSSLLAKRYIDNIDIETQTPEMMVSFYISMIQNKVLRSVKEKLRK